MMMTGPERVTYSWREVHYCDREQVFHLASKTCPRCDGEFETTNTNPPLKLTCSACSEVFERVLPFPHSDESVYEYSLDFSFYTIDEAKKWRDGWIQDHDDDDGVREEAEAWVLARTTVCEVLNLG